MSDPDDHHLALELLIAVADELEGDEGKELLSDRELIKDLLALGVHPAPERVAEWVRDADHD